jgi:Putative DNA-binding domain
MPSLTPKELLDYLLQDNTLGQDELGQFIQEHPDEGQYFDYKNGSITSRHKREREGKLTIREYVSGFANSDGGVLIIGVDEQKPRQIAPCEQRPGGLALDDWAARCLHDMVGYFSPLPRYQIIRHSQGFVLTIAVARAPSLVPCIESRDIKYFFRIGASTLQAPEYLVADLVLGRRQHPFIDLRFHAKMERLQDISIENSIHLTRARGTTLSFVVENLSLVTAENVRVGVVFRALGNGPATNINRHLREYLDINEVSPPGLRADFFDYSRLVHEACGDGLPLVPFQNLMMPYQAGYLGPFYFPSDIPIKILGAAYVTSRGSPPTWFQLELNLSVNDIHKGTIEGVSDPIVTRKGAERPKIAWETE